MLMGLFLPSSRLPFWMFPLPLVEQPGSPLPFSRWEGAVSHLSLSFYTACHCLFLAIL